MPKRALSLLCCVVVFAFLSVGCSSGDAFVNEIPEGESLSQYNQAIAEIESEEELEN